jgi:hypothetical protein
MNTFSNLLTKIYADITNNKTNYFIGSSKTPPCSNSLPETLLSSLSIDRYDVKVVFPYYEK